MVKVYFEVLYRCYLCLGVLYYFHVVLHLVNICFECQHEVNNPDSYTKCMAIFIATPLVIVGAPLAYYANHYYVYLGGQSPHLVYP